MPQRAYDGLQVHDRLVLISRVRAVWPDHPHGCRLSGVGNHVGGSAVDSCRSAIPDRVQLIGLGRV